MEQRNVKQIAKVARPIYFPFTKMKAMGQIFLVKLFSDKNAEAFGAFNNY